MTTRMLESLLTVADAARLLGTWDTSGERFPRRLIAERRIRFVRVGRLVRIPESALIEYIEAQTVQPVTRRNTRKAA
ncbi:excisionase family DNA-binding protein [Kribbella sp. NBC_01245]|uniref:excisionase family DNA-binding protein n=1 Tax=Kribbella sp. NBC_01245 TaxID=2903578 RepID=UPI002E2D0D17|nr:excisionase family DNA-binding protein [Kribbella sp. NBC_01245]